MFKTTLIPLAFLLLATAACPKATEVQVPDLTGMTSSQASTTLSLLGLTLGDIVEAYSGTVPAGQVFGQNPTPSTTSPVGASVNVLVSLGATPGANGQPTITAMLPGAVPLKLVRVPAGTFTMGSSENEQDRMKDEGPARLITIASPYYMGQTEITKRQWLAVMGTAPWTGRQDVTDESDTPAVYVSWNDIQQFIDRASAQTGLAFRLPSEAEWEYAARAGSTGRFYWGADPNYHLINMYAWWDGNCQEETHAVAHPVGLRRANAWRLYDMSGNGWEYVQDWYHFGYTGAPADASPWLLPEGSGRVRRGGSWDSPGSFSRSAYRSLMVPDGSDASTTFRLFFAPEDNS